MNRSRLVAIIGFCAIVILLISASARSQAPQPSTTARSEAGTFELFKITKNGEDELYRINTKTGQVWLYSEYIIPSSDMAGGAKGPEKDGLDKLIAEAARQGKHVYTLPFWDLTAEKRPSTFTIH